MQYNKKIYFYYTKKYYPYCSPYKKTKNNNKKQAFLSQIKKSLKKMDNRDVGEYITHKSFSDC